MVVMITSQYVSAWRNPKHTRYYVGNVETINKKRDRLFLSIDAHFIHLDLATDKPNWKCMFYFFCIFVIVIFRTSYTEPKRRKTEKFYEWEKGEDIYLRKKYLIYFFFCYATTFKNWDKKCDRERGEMLEMVQIRVANHITVGIRHGYRKTRIDEMIQKIELCKRKI